MQLTIVFSILFASTACTQPLSQLLYPREAPDSHNGLLPRSDSPSSHSSGSLNNIIQQFPSPPHSDLPSSHSSGTLNDIIQQFPSTPGGTLNSHDIQTGSGLTCGVTEAWRDHKRLIKGWPGVDQAYQTTFKNQLAVITHETVSLFGKRFVLKDINSLQLAGQLFGYASESTTFRTTYYIVRKWMGDTWETASGNGLTLQQAKELIAAAKGMYQTKNIVPEERKDEEKLYAYLKNPKDPKNTYLGAVLISWKKSSLAPYNKLRKVSNAHCCVETWKPGSRV